MDGQKILSKSSKGKQIRAAALIAALAIAVICWPLRASAQAMGKAAVEPGAAALAPPAPKETTPPKIEPAKEAAKEIVERPLEKSPLIGPVAPVELSAAPEPITAAISAAKPAPAAPAETAAPVETEEPAAVTPAPPAKETSPAPGVTAKSTSPIELEPIRPRPSGPGKNGEAIGAGAAGGVGVVTGQPAAALGLPAGLGSLGQVAAALAIVIGLIFIGKAAVRKFVPGANVAAGKGVIEILARHPLTKNQSIVLVRIGSQIVALNQGKDASESVLVISDAAEVAKIIGQIEGRNPASSQAGFTRLLANARVDLEQTDSEEPEVRSMDPENLDEQLEEMAAAKRQLMELRQHVRSVRDSLPRT